MFRFPKNSARFRWTDHIKSKMLFYGISETKVKSILRSPERKEEGVAPETTAAMKRNDKKKRREEIWIMYRPEGNHTVFISAWRYPGITKVGDRVPIPEDIISDLAQSKIK